MNVGNKIEYIAADEARQKIPWVRMTDAQGVVTEFRHQSSRKVSQLPSARMDCMDCHNRPAHRYETPESAVNLALALGKIDRSLPYIKTNAICALTRDLQRRNRSVARIATFLPDRYPRPIRASARDRGGAEDLQRQFLPRNEGELAGVSR